MIYEGFLFFLFNFIEKFVCSNKLINIVVNHSLSFGLRHEPNVHLSPLMAQPWWLP